MRIQILMKQIYTLLAANKTNVSVRSNNVQSIFLKPCFLQVRVPRKLVQGEVFFLHALFSLSAAVP
ncbi:hypothetical protein AAAC51_10075 [Priestia megaterium]